MSIRPTLPMDARLIAVRRARALFEARPDLRSADLRIGEMVVTVHRLPGRRDLVVSHWRPAGGAETFSRRPS